MLQWCETRALRRSHFVEWKETTMISMSFVRTIHLHERSHVLRRLYKHFFHWVHVASQVICRAGRQQLG
eukprot:366782-Hanusia_phi.AAC.3